VANDTTVCEKFCIDFFDQSVNNPTSWLWLFPGGNPSTSTDQNPSQVCYNLPGTYDVMLITTSVSGNDTLVLSNFITVYPTPPFPTITQNGYVLTSSSAMSYQWQLNSADIPGATNQTYTVTQSGFYTVIISDENDCENSFTVYVLIDGIENSFSNSSITVSPNPSDGDFTIQFSEVLTNESFRINVLNILGEVIFSFDEKNSSTSFSRQIHLNNVTAGIYYLEIKSESFSSGKKLLIEN